MTERLSPNRIYQKWSLFTKPEHLPNLSDKTLYILCLDILRLRAVPQITLLGSIGQVYSISCDRPTRSNSREMIQIQEYRAGKGEDSSLVQISHQKPRGREKFGVSVTGRPELTSVERGLLIQEIWTAFENTLSAQERS